MELHCQDLEDTIIKIKKFNLIDVLRKGKNMWTKNKKNIKPTTIIIKKMCSKLNKK